MVSASWMVVLEVVWFDDNVGQAFLVSPKHSPKPEMLLPKCGEAVEAPNIRRETAKMSATTPNSAVQMLGLAAFNFYLLKVMRVFPRLLNPVFMLPPSERA